MEIYTVPPPIKTADAQPERQTQGETGQAHVSALRYERKYIAPGMGRSDAAMMLKLNPAVFSPLYHERYINNIYLDTPFFDAYHETLAGVANRKKVRIRWYGALQGDISGPVLELKIKRGLPGYKVSVPLAPFTLGDVFTKNDLRDVLERSALPAGLAEELAMLQPRLLNRYKRGYFISGDKKFRVTVDTSQSFHDIFRRGGMHRQIKIDDTVIELKYDCEEEQHADCIATRFPFRLSRNSKYATGVATLWGRG